MLFLLTILTLLLFSNSLTFAFGDTFNAIIPLAGGVDDLVDRSDALGEALMGDGFRRSEINLKKNRINFTHSSTNQFYKIQYGEKFFFCKMTIVGHDFLFFFSLQANLELIRRKNLQKLNRIKMSSEKSSSTSTPVAQDSDQKVLRENFTNISTIKREIASGKFKPLRVMKNSSTKENFHRSRPRTSQKFNKTKESLMEKRRQQAVEAMKIAEQRRRRLHEDDETSLCEDMTNVVISPVKYLPDGRIQLTPKQLALRREKHRRIYAFLAEQEARKKAQAARRKKSQLVVFKTKPFSWVPRSIFSNTRSSVHLNRNIKRKSLQFSPERVEEEEEEKGTPTAAVTFVEKKDSATQVTPTSMPTDAKVIRYTADELRELSPYGYFFM